MLFTHQFSQTKHVHFVIVLYCIVFIVDFYMSKRTVLDFLFIQKRGLHLRMPFLDLARLAEFCSFVSM